MKRSKSAAVLAAVFSAAMNMNGCVYGPPPEEARAPAPQTSVVSQGEQNDVSDEVSSDVSENEALEASEQ